jgi:hypothetical protein
VTSLPPPRFSILRNQHGDINVGERISFFCKYIDI